jgi:hypothetical protein
VALGAVGGAWAGQPPTALASRQGESGDYALTNGVYSVVAQGISAMPADMLAGRLVKDSALLATDAPVLERALGFVIATAGPLAIADEAGARAWLSTEEAAFVPEAAMQRHMSFANDASPYLRIGLVDTAEREYAADGELVFASGGFAAPGGVRDLNLIYGYMGQGEATRIPDTGNPTLLVVASGEISFGGSAGSLGMGEAMALTGPIAFTATTPVATFYAALLGVEVVVKGR